MKYAIVLPDGAADEPFEQLDGQTPLEAARTPNLDWIGTNGRQGRVSTALGSTAPDSDVSTLTLLGYDTRTEYTARGPLEAVAQGITVRPGRLVFRCNFVTITDKLMEDYTAGRISQAEADRLVTVLNEQLADKRCQFHGGSSYRALMVASDVPDFDARCTPPHAFPDGLVSEHLPRGPGAEWIKTIMDRAGEILAEHDVNAVRRDLGENPATGIWLWGPGKPRKLEPLTDRFGIGGTLVSGADLFRGMALTIGMELVNMPAAAGFLDTDYAGKGAAAASALDSTDLVIVHVQAPDEASHLGDADAKIAAIEQIDEHVVGPLLEKLRQHDRWRILIAPNHTTSVEHRVHTLTPPPFCLAGHAVQTALQRPFSERAAASSDLQVDPGHELMEYFLRS